MEDTERIMLQTDETKSSPFKDWVMIIQFCWSRDNNPNASQNPKVKLKALI